MFKKLFVFILLSLMFSIYCQKDSTGPEPEPEGPWGWAKRFEKESTSILSSVQQTGDGGFVVVGSKGGLWLIRTDGDGDTLWTKLYRSSQSGSGNGHSICITSDGGFGILGGTGDSEGSTAIWLLKTDSNGDTLWTEIYGGASDDKGVSLKVTNDGGFIIVGYTESFGAGNRDVYLLKTDVEGNFLWDKTYGGADLDYGSSVALTTDGGYIVAGGTRSFSKSGSKAYLIKTDSDGDTLWTKTFGDVELVSSVVVDQTSDGGYVVVGTTGIQGGNSDALLMKTDSLGDSLWSKTYGGSSYDYGCSFDITTDGGFVITGETRSYGTYDTGDIWLFKTDNEGNSEWTWTYSTQISYGRGLEVHETTNGDFILVGVEDYPASGLKGKLIRKY